MKWIRIALVVLASALLISAVSAYLIKVDAPDSIIAGQPLTVTIENNLPGGFTTDVIFYRAEYTKSEITRNTVTFQGETLVTTFQTAGLQNGNYQVEVVDPTKDTFGGSSTTLKMVEIVNRADSITITSRRTQEFDGTLDLSGSIRGLQGNGILLTVHNDDRSGEIVFGPEFVANGSGGTFSEEIPIPQAGTYRVNFSDRKGLIGYVSFDIAGIATPTTVVPTVTATGAMLSASATASRAIPAYFTVATKTGQVRIATSSGIDWVVEYIDDSGNRKLVNEKGADTSEEVTFSAHGGTVNVKVYPMAYSDQGTVVLSAQNADAVTVATDGAAVFGDQAPTPTPEAPMPWVLVFLAFGFILFLKK